MKIEHIAFNVAHPVEMARWYENNLQLTTVINMEVSPFTHFLADDSGNVMIEIYNNPPDQVPDYAAMNPLICHLAFASDHIDDDKSRLIAAGAMLVDEVKLSDGTHLAMMRDPWGLAIQLCKRAKPMLLCQK